MNVLRPIRPSDIDTLLEIAHHSGPGFTSLPNNPELIEAKLAHAVASMQQEVITPGQESYLFMLENTETQRVVGTCGIEAAVGTRDPWYHYRLGTVVHASRELDVHNRFRTLYLCNDYTGYAEVCTLYLLPEARQTGAGSLLSRARFMFMAEFPERFAESVIAEMRGVSNAKGVSPFWEGLGRKFFTIEFSQADYLTGTGNKAFVAELMPKHTLYIHLLPREARKVIGQVHENTQPARKMLEQEGFQYQGYIDIFDAGPTLCSRVKDIRTIRRSRYCKVLIGTPQPGERQYLISNTSRQEFRCTQAPLHISDHGCAILSPEMATALRVEEGHSVRISPLR